ncbi:CDP-alcohol phosphatidyltransferase family protein [Aquihabitans sp. G128]|uniref:CDP-alcohol phosphatidyltransferase family protein n=1 Tax=Aquihabitans sp. G128 TaxID=2849779 RepID=UPI001C22AADD|nr:CDP-alcohol phosphatidyltransferase family protein [Aquihabitans sp. G128]QXC59136.1 CDP-alcohol phosphatidyltransferase family protein [Aquihabitans sp. G128]
MSASPTPQATSGFGLRTREALGKLSGAQKSKVGVPAYLRYVNRRAGGWIAAVGYGLGLTPNHLTALSALFSFAAIAALAVVDPGPAAAAAIAVSLLLGYAFDSADGQLSRVRGGGKPSGEWLDHVVDVAKTSSLHAGVLVSLARFADLGSNRWLALPLAFGIVNITFFFGMMLRDQLGGKPAKPTEAPSGAGAGSALRSVVLLPMDYGTLCLAFFLLAAPTAFLVAYGALFAFMALFTAQSFVKAYRTLAA